MSTADTYTPEYSEELLALVVELFNEEIRPDLGDLKLSKMIDLLEVAEWNLEQYHSHRQKDEHLKQLRYYIIGLLYIYLVIPASIQFQFKNKNYEVFLSLKQLFEKETSMSNVKLVTINYISYITDKENGADLVKIKSRTKRSATLPTSTLEPDLSQYLKPPGATGDKLSQSSRRPSGTELSSLSSVGTNASATDDLWRPPDLQPNDQLKLASTDNLMETLHPQPPSNPPPQIPTIPETPTRASDLRFSTPPPRLTHAKSFPQPEEAGAGATPQDIGTIPEEYFEPSTSHRKDSYHSVFAEDDDQYEAKQTMSVKSLYEQLTVGALSFFIIDIRPKERFESNHIPYDNIINIDPSLVVNSESYQELEDVIRTSATRESFYKFCNLNKYDQVLTYSDSRTFLVSDVDYISKMFVLLDQKRVTAKTLRGGFDSWTKYLSKNDISKKKLHFIAKQPYVAPHPPSIPPPPVPQGDDLSPKSSGTITSSQVESRETYSQGRIPPVPPPHSVGPYPETSRPYPVQQSFYSSTHQSPPFPPQYQQPLQPLQYQTSPAPVQHQVYARAPAQVPRSDTQLAYYNNGYHQEQQPYHQQVPEAYRQRVNSSSIPTIQRSPNQFVRLSITGLRNLGNTCYINSMIQCLFASTLFRDVFITNKFESYINPKFRKAPLAPSLATLFKKMYLNGGCSIVPSGFLKACVQLRPDLRIPSEQQDTQEFLMFLLDHLHDELSNSNVVVNDYPELMNHEPLGDEYEKWFDGLIRQGLSPISKIFQGQLQDSLQCKNCGHKSSNFSTFYMLSLVIPKHHTYGKKVKRVALEDCIEMFTKDEVLDGDNAWDCPKCSKKPEAPVEQMLSPTTTAVKLVEKERKHRLHFTNGFRFRGRSSSPAPKEKKKILEDGIPKKKKNSTIKSLTFVVLPPILIIHLARFLFYDTSQKDTAVVQYPLILEIPHKGKMVKYKLFGVVNHSGTLKSGHYTSIANKNLDHDLIQPDWFYFDDETVKHTEHGSFNGRDQTHMSSSDVYVLLYEKIE